MVPANAICFFNDGERWNCVFGDFIDDRESPIGTGATFQEAYYALQATGDNRATIIEELPDTPEVSVRNRTGSTSFPVDKTGTRVEPEDNGPS